MDLSREEIDTITIKVRDYDYQLVKMLRYIMTIANYGHSFDVVVDPSMSEYKKSFFMDGDGAFHIKDLKKNGIKVNDKIVEGYLKRIQ